MLSDKNSGILVSNTQWVLAYSLGNIKTPKAEVCVYQKLCI